MESFQLSNPDGMVNIETGVASDLSGAVEIKNVDTPQEDEMAEFSTPISELMQQEPDPQTIQREPPVVVSPMLKTGAQKAASKKKGSLSPEQMDAVVAGIAAVIAFSKPVQEKLVQMVPGASQGLTGTLLTALLAAVIFFFGKKFMAKRT